MSEAVVEAPSVAEAIKLHERGLALARNRHFEQAIGLFQATLKADPKNVEALRHLAQAYTDAGQLDEAEKAWLEYLDHLQQEVPDGAQGSSQREASPNKAAEAHRHLGNLRKRMEKLDLAIESLQKAVSLEAKSPAYLVDLGVALAQAKRRPEAKQSFQRALELDTNFYDALINLGMLQQEMGEHRESLVHLRKAIELRPDDPSGYNNLGVALAEQGELAEAIACYEKLLAKTPDYVLAWNNLGNALRSSGRNEEAVTALYRPQDTSNSHSRAKPLRPSAPSAASA